MEYSRHDLGGMVQGDAGKREQQHPDQADGCAHPMLLMRVLEPERAAYSARGQRAAADWLVEPTRSLDLQRESALPR
jgi:hypothetical protein